MPRDQQQSSANLAGGTGLSRKSKRLLAWPITRHAASLLLRCYPTSAKNLPISVKISVLPIIGEISLAFFLKNFVTLS